MASDAAISYDHLADRYRLGQTGLESLGFTSAETLAGSALLGTKGTVAWSKGRSNPPPTDRLNVTIFDKPVLHVGNIATLMKEHPDPWQGDAPNEVSEVRDARRMMIELFKNAAAGRLEGAFSTARKLAVDHGDVGEAAIEQLIAPHISDARKAIARAKSEGPNSTHWDDALRFATTAQMLAPGSPEYAAEAHPKARAWHNEIHLADNHAQYLENTASF